MKKSRKSCFLFEATPNVRHFWRCVSLLLITFICFNFIACNPFNFSNEQSDDFSLSNSSSDNSNEEPNTLINTIGKSTFYESNNKYNAVDSYIMDDGNYYYFYYLGAIDFVPLNLSTAKGVYFNGSNLSLEFSFSSTNIEQEQRTLKNTIENSIELTTKTYKEVSISHTTRSSFEAKINKGIENNATTTISNTYEESYTIAISNETTFEKNVTYTMSKDDPVGYYFYTSVASAKIYEIVVYNPEEKAVKFMSSYAQFGMALPGLFYSPFSFLDYSSFEVAFDETLITNFETPTTTVSNKALISLDSNGGECEVSSLDGRIGETYGALPTPIKPGYIFDGWMCNNEKVTSDSIITTTNTLIAKWNIILSGLVEINESFNMDTLSDIQVGIPLTNLFDFATLKDEGYKMRITLKYSVKRSTLAINGANYKFTFTSNGKNIVIFNNFIDLTNYVQKTEYSDYVPLTNVDGNLYFSPSTTNVFMVYIKDLKITIDFAK